MTLSIIVFLALYLLFALILFARPLITVFESLIALILGVIVSMFYFQKILDIANSFGLKEDIYTPSLIFILTVTVVWALVFTFLTLLVNVGHITKSYKSKYFSFIISGFFTVICGIVICLTITPFIQNTQILNDIENCLLCKIVRNTTANISSLDGNLSKISPDIYMPENEQNAIRLTDDFTNATFNLDKSNQALELVNLQRTKQSQPALIWDSKLKDLAYNYGQEISKTKYFSHTSVDGKTGIDRAQELDLDYDYLGENLAIAPTLEQAHDALVDSESHHKNIISPIFTKAGIAVFDLDNGCVVLIQEFSS